jgi:glycosyltransferase involved in cell wall biosynthesis
MNKKVAFIADNLRGGGSERVISVLANHMVELGIDVEIIILKAMIIEYKLSDKIRIVNVNEEVKKLKISVFEKICTKLLWFAAKIGLFLMRRSESRLHDYCVYKKFSAMHYSQIKYIINHMRKTPETTLISFVEDSNYVTLCSSRKLKNKIIISERTDPQYHYRHEAGRAFTRTYYKYADIMVFQTKDAQQFYPECIQQKSFIILNPIKENLPDIYHGKRRHRIVNFCRLEPQKNLLLLIEAFSLISKEYPDYTLHIYGEGSIKNQLNEYIRQKQLEDRAFIEPFQNDIHDTIRDCSMFVSSSDWEGLSNSVLEAMAIGLPTICTDCPIGGAKMVVRNSENGLIIPVGDITEMYQAMKTVIEDPLLAEKMSLNGVRLKNELSARTIVEQWVGLL